MFEIPPPLARSSYKIRAKARIELFQKLSDDAKQCIHMLDDVEASAVKRVAESKLFGFPSIVHGHHEEAVVKYGGNLASGPIDSFFKSIDESHLFLFFEPWLLFGAAIIEKQFVIENFWSLMTYCDYSGDMYDTKLSRTCAIRDHEQVEAIHCSISI
jgi:hypothetical protein